MAISKIYPLMKQTYVLLVCCYQNKILEACTRLKAEKEKRSRVKRMKITSERNKMDGITTCYCLYMDWDGFTSQSRISMKIDFRQRHEKLGVK